MHLVGENTIAVADGRCGDKKQLSSGTVVFHIFFRARLVTAAVAKRLLVLLHDFYGLISNKRLRPRDWAAVVVASDYSTFDAVPTVQHLTLSH